MKTDTLFYRLFKQWPGLLFDMLGRTDESQAPYRFESVEVKQSGFRIDGVLEPMTDSPELPIYFVEVQFQKDQHLYYRYFAEIFLYLRHNRPNRPWRGVVIYPDRVIEETQKSHFQEFFQSGRIDRIYLREFSEQHRDQWFGRLLGLVVAPEREAVPLAKELVEHFDIIGYGKNRRHWLDIIEIVMVYKLPRMSRDEVRRMLNIADVELKQTQFYKEVVSEGRKEGRKKGRKEGRKEEAERLVNKLLERRLGQLPDLLSGKIGAMPIDNLEELAEALLDFNTFEDLHQWFDDKG